jgi:hypothetical protein
MNSIVHGAPIAARAAQTKAISSTITMQHLLLHCKRKVFRHDR